MIHEFNKTIPVITPLGNGYILYVTSNGMFENDEFTIVMDDGGIIKHFTSDQVRIWHNETYNINKNK